MNKETKVLASKYMLASAWVELNKDAPGQQQIKVIEAIEKLETGLKQQGLTSVEIDGLLQRVKKFVKTPIGDLNTKQLETVYKLVFGQNVKESFGSVFKKHLIIFDPTKVVKPVDKKQ